jgi:AraC-like DNA-binding protein
MDHFKKITEQNKLSLNKPPDSDIVYYSELNEWFTSNAFRSFSIKCVIDGTIYYKIGTRVHPVRAGQFLLSVKQPYVNAYFTSYEKTKSICIDICPGTVNQVFTIMTEKKDPQFDNYLAKYYQFPDFLETTSVLMHSATGKKLRSLVDFVGEEPKTVSLGQEWFYDIMESIVQEEYGTYTSLSNIKSLRASTKKELIRRLKTARDYMDENFLEIESIAEIATAADLSEYHFFRSFRQAFQISPHQYLLRKRLELSEELIKSGHLTLTSVALRCGFPDIFTFSKAYKKKYGISPSRA